MSVIITINGAITEIDLDGNGSPEYVIDNNAHVVYFDPDNNSSTNNSIPIPFCFLPGTMVATPNGEVAIETLKHGDLVLTAQGEAKPVRWVGRQSVSKTFADPARSMPICIKAGALGENLPTRDLFASPSHALFVDGMLVEASALVNGTSIVRHTDVAENFTYYNVELADHSLILTEGVPAETFVDNVSRMGFDNWAEHEAIVGAAPIKEMDLPRAKSYRQVPAAVHQRIAAIAGVTVSSSVKAA